MLLGWAFTTVPALSVLRLGLLALSAFPVFALGYWMRRSCDLPYVIQASLVLALGDLLLISMASQVYDDLRREMRRAYVLAARARGGTALRHYWRRLCVIVLESAQPRIPFLLGSSVVVERIYAVDGLGEMAVSAVERGEVVVLVWLALLSFLLVRVCGFAIELIRCRLTPEFPRSASGQQGRLRQLLLDTLDAVRGGAPGKRQNGPSPRLSARTSGATEGESEGPATGGTESGSVVHALRVRAGNYVLRSRWNAPKAAVAAGTVLLAAGILALCLLGPRSEISGGLERQFEEPSSAHLLGLDEDGKDILAQLLMAGRFLVPPVTVALVLVVAAATPLGLLSGYFAGRSVRFVDRSMDVLDSVPKLVLVLLAIVVFDAKEGYLWKVIPFMGLTFAPGIFYQVRNTARLLRERLFVERARALGSSEARIVFLHILWKNCRHRLLIYSAYILGGIVLMDASIGYLKLSQPDYPTWGALAMKGVLSANEYGRVAMAGTAFNEWAVWGPFAVLVVMLVASSLLGDSLRTLLGDEES